MQYAVWKRGGARRQGTRRLQYNLAISLSIVLVTTLYTTVLPRVLGEAAWDTARMMVTLPECRNCTQECQGHGLSSWGSVILELKRTVAGEPLLGLYICACCWR